jgi:hypothetical protein
VLGTKGNSPQQDGQYGLFGVLVLSIFGVSGSAFGVSHGGAVRLGSPKSVGVSMVVMRDFLGWIGAVERAGRFDIQD